MGGPGCRPPHPGAGIPDEMQDQWEPKLMFVDGRIQQRDQKLAIRNPFNGAVAGCVSKDTPEDVQTALASLKTYDHSLTGEKRSQILKASAEELLRSKEQFARRISEESGMCIKDSRGEVDRSC